MVLRKELKEQNTYLLKMIPSYASSNLIQYKGFLKKICVDLDNVNRIKVTDYKTQSIIFNDNVRLENKLDWSSNGYSQEYRYLFEKVGNTENNSSRIYLVTDKDSKRIKIMSLDNTYVDMGMPRLDIEYKTDESIKSDNVYDIEFGHITESESEQSCSNNCMDKIRAIIQN